MSAADVERVARALCRHHGIEFMSEEGIELYVEMYWRDHMDEARVVMRATRLIDAEAYLEQHGAGCWDAIDKAEQVADWLKGRAG